MTLALGALSMTCHASDGTGCGAIRILQAVGFDTHLPLDGPTCMQWIQDGTMVVLNEENCSVAELTPDLELVRTFGRCGEAPGEFQNAMGLVVCSDSLYISTMGRTHVFTETGDPVRSISTIFYPRLFNIRGRLYAFRSKRGRIFAELDVDGNEHDNFGPESDDWKLQWLLLERPKSGFTAIELHDGRGTLMNSNKEIERTVDLGLGRGWQHGGRGKNALSDACFDSRNSRYLVLYYPEIGSKPRIASFDADLKHLETWVLCPDPAPGEIAVAPDGHIYMLCYEASMLYEIQLSSSP